MDTALAPAASDPGSTFSVPKGAGPPRPDLTGFLRCALSYVAPYWQQSLLVLLALTPIAAFFALQPLVFRSIIDDSIPGRDGARLALLVAILVGLVALRLVSEVAREYFAARVAAGVTNDLRLKIFDHLQHFSLGFYRRAEVGDLMSRYTDDLSAIDQALLRDCPSGLSRALTLAACVLVLFALDWRLALVGLVPVLGLASGPRFLGSMAERAGRRRQQDADRLASTVQESIGAQPVIEVFGLREPALARFRGQIAQFTRSSARLGLLCGLQAATAGAGATSLRALAVGLGAVLVIRGGLSLGTLFAFAELLWYVTDSLQGLSALARPLGEASASNGRVQQLLHEPARVVDAEDAQPLPPFSREIRFHGVTFSYSGVELTLKGVSFAIPHGWSVAFVGPSGCGKSTIVSLLMRLYEPSGGYVTIDGWDLRQVTQESLRAQLGVIFQDNFVFNATLRENIRVGRPSATDAEVESAARAAEIHDFIAGLPDGYDTPVGARGGRLSAGHRQRIAIARAILRDPVILVLDEATSALDLESEAAINTTLERVARGRTVISVTHRLASVQKVDRIFVLDRGQVVEQGTHEELLARTGAYHELWQKQSGLSVNDEGSRAEVEAVRLRLIPILNLLEEDLLTEVASRFVTEGVVEGRTVIHEGDPGDRFYIIVRGTAEVVKTAADGGEQRLAILQDGDHFGEIALLKNVPRTATVRTLAPTVFLTLQRGQFLELVEKAPHLRQALEQINLSRIVDGTAPA
jgi:ATP-binding cassette subfamily B protein